MKKNYLIMYSTKKPTKKNAAQLRENKITKILSMISAICDYAIDNNLCTQQTRSNELEQLLRDYIK